MAEERYHGTPEALRDSIQECLQMTSFYSGMAVDYAGYRDDAGLDYSVRCAVASLKAGVSVLKMLKELNLKHRKAHLAAKAEQSGADVALGL